MAFYSTGNNGANANDNVALKMEELNDSYIIYGQLNNVNPQSININYDSVNSIVTVSAIVNTKITNDNAGGFGVTIEQNNTVTKNFKVENIEATKIKGDFDGVNLNVTVPKLISSSGSFSDDELIIDVEDYEME